MPNFGHSEKSKIYLLGLASVKEIELAHQTASHFSRLLDASRYILLFLHGGQARLGTLLVELLIELEFNPNSVETQSDLNRMRAFQCVETHCSCDLVIGELHPDGKFRVALGHKYILHENRETLFQPQISPPFLQSTTA